MESVNIEKISSLLNKIISNEIILLFLVFFTFLFFFLFLKQRGENKRLKIKARDYKRSYNSMLRNIGSTYAAGVSSFISSFYEYSEITRHSVQVSKDKIEIKIGDEEYMVKVDHELFAHDAVAALEQAKLYWDKTKKFK